MKKFLFKWIVCLSALFALVTTFELTSNTVGAATYDKTEMRNFVRNTLAKYKARGTILVIKDGQPQQISYGYGFYGKRLGAGNSKVVYPICSLQKILTGAIITQLIYEGKLNADMSIAKWYPQIKNANNITIGNLLTHTSGIIMTGTETNRGVNYSEKAAINWVANQVSKRTENNPGTFSYNNTNFILLAGIIRQVTGKSYETNVKERIIKPLGLKNTYFYNEIPKSKTHAVSYTFNKYNYQDPLTVKNTVASQIPGAGNIFSTPMDYYKIQLGLTNGKILTQTQFDYLTNLPVRKTTYSGGLYLKKNRTVKMAYGNLYKTHFSNWFQMTTDNQNGMIMFLNQTNAGENDNKVIGYQILNHIKANTFAEK